MLKEPQFKHLPWILMGLFVVALAPFLEGAPCPQFSGSFYVQGEPKPVVISDYGDILTSIPVHFFSKGLKLPTEKAESLQVSPDGTCYTKGQFEDHWGCNRNYEVWFKPSDLPEAKGRLLMKLPRYGFKDCAADVETWVVSYELFGEPTHRPNHYSCSRLVRLPGSADLYFFDTITGSFTQARSTKPSISKILESLKEIDNLQTQACIESSTRVADDKASLDIQSLKVF